MRDDEASTLLKRTVHGFHVLHKWAGGAVPSQSMELHEMGVDGQFDMMCQLCILFPLHFVVFKQTVCHLTAETNVEQVFARRDNFQKLILTQTPSLTWFR
jgi:hypothetical protein